MPRRPGIGLGLFLLVVAAAPVGAQFTYSEDFKNSTAPGWSFYQGSSGPGPRLTSGLTGTAGADPEGAVTIDPTGSGWLRLATNTTQQANAVFFDTPIPSAGNEVKITFNVNMWENNTGFPTGADGLTFFLYDASVPFSVGAFGGSLGYAQKDAAQGADTTANGMGGGFLGIALDAYGNYSRAAEGREGGTTALAPNAVVVRGPGSGQDGYNYLAGTTGSNGTLGYDYTDSGGATGHDTEDGVVAALPYTMAFANATARPDQSTQYRRVEFTLTETSQLIIRMQFGEDGLWYDILSADVSSFARPEQLRFGFSAGTGAGSQVYEVGGLLQITATAGSGSFLWDRGDNSNVWGTGPTDPINWFGNTNPTSKSNVVFNSAYVSGAQTVDLRDTDKTVKNIYFSGSDAYTLVSTDSTARKLIFDSDTVGGLTTMSITPDVGGNAAHSVNVDVLMNKTLDINNTVSTHTFTLSGNIDTNGNALSFKGTGTTQATGIISGAGTLTKSDTGTTILSGASANTYTGATTVNAGTLRIEKAGALGSTASGTSVNAGGTLALGGTGTTFDAEDLTLNGSGVGANGALRNVAGANTWTGTVALASASTVGVDGGTSLGLSGVISGTGALTKAGTGTLTLAGTNTYTGATAINAGTVVISSEANLGGPTAGPLTLDGGTLRTVTSTVTIDDANRSVTIGTGGGTFDTNSDLMISNAVGGTGALTKAGTGTLTLSGSNTHSGSIAIDAGTLTVNSGSALGDSAAVTIGTGATLNTAGVSETVGSIAGAGNLTLGSPGSGTALTVGGNDASTTFSGVISGGANADVVKTGAGTLTLSGANTFTGDLQVNQGTVALGANNALSNSATLVLNGGTFATHSAGSGYSDTIGGVSLLSSSAIDYGSLGGLLTFTNGSRTAGTLTIYGWAGDLSGGGASQLILSNFPTGFGGTDPNLDNITFDGYGAGAIRLVSGEIVPVTGTVFTWNSAGTTWANNANWDSSPDGFPGGTGHTAIFGSALTADLTLSLAATRTLGYLTFNDNNNVTLQNNTLNFNVSAGSAQLNVSNSGSATISSAVTLSDNLTVNQNSTGTLTISGGITNASGTNNLAVGGSGNTTLSGVIGLGAGGLTKTGTGTLTLSGTNTYTGRTVINSGVLAISNENQLGSNPAASVSDQLTLNGGTLRTQTAAVTINDTNREIFIGSAGGTFDTVTNLTIANTNVMSGAGTVTKTGTGVLSISAANTHTGDFVVNAGTLLTSGGSAIGNSALVTVNTGATWQTGASETVGNIAGAGSITFTGSNTLTFGDGSDRTFSGVISDGANTGILTKQGAGTVVLSGANTYDGATNINAGALNIRHNSGLGATTGDTFVATGAALELEGGVTIAAGESLTLSGTGVTASPNGALRNVSGANAYAGNITLNADTEIQADADTLTLGGTINGNAASRTLVFDGAGNITATGAIGANVSTVTKTGAGTLTLSGSNTYTGVTSVNAGTVVVGSATGLGATGAGTTVANAATLSFTNAGSMTVAEGLTVSGQGVGSLGALRNLAGTNTLSGTIALNAETYVGIAIGTQLTASGVVSGNFGLTKVDTGTLVLSGTNTYTGTTAVNAGTLVAQSASALGTNANPTTVASGATLALSGNFTTTETATLAGTGVGGAGALQGISGTNTISGNLNLVADTSIGVSSGAALTASGVVSGAGFGLTKVGTGTLTLAGANTYTGATTVSAGTLVAAASSPVSGNGALGNASSAVQLGDANSGGSAISLLAGGTGGVSLARDISVNNLGGTVTLGGSNTAGVNTFSGDIALGKNVTLTAATGGTVEFTGDLGGTGGITTAGAGNISLSGSNTFTGTSTFGGTGIVTLQGSGSGALGSTSGVTLSTGSITLLGASNQINDSAGLTLSGGTLRLNGYQEILTDLTLTANSTLDYAGESSLLRFTGVSTRTAGQLTIDNWAGDPVGGSSGYGLLFNTQSEATDFEDFVTFNGWAGAGLNQVVANGSFWEIVPLVTVKEWNLASGSGNWDTNGNWTGGSQPDGNGQIAKFGDVITAGTTATINTAATADTETVGNLLFATTGARNYVISGADNIVFNTGGTAASQLIVSGDGQHTISSNITAASRLVITNDGTATAPLTISGNLALPNATGDDFTVGGTGRTAISGVISGASSSLLKTGSGTLALSGANTYTGATTIRNGTIEVAGNAPSGAAGNLGNATSAVVLNDSGTSAGANTALLMTDADGGSTIGRAITVNNFGATTTLGGTNTSGTNTFSGSISLGKDVTLTAAAGGTVAFTGALSGTGGLTKEGTGTVSLGGSTQNTFTGNVAVNAGTLQIAKTTTGVDALPASGNQGALGDSAAVTIASGATLSFNGDANQTLEEIGSLSGAAGSNVNVAQATALTLYTGQNNASTTYAGTLTDTGGNLSLVKQGTGTMTLSGANTHDGTTTVAAGTLLVTHGSALGSTNAGTAVTAGATLALQNNITLAAGEALTLGTSSAAATASLHNVSGANIIAGNIGLSGTAAHGARLDTATGSTLTLTGAITQTNASFLTKTGGGTLELGGTTASTFSGGLTVRDGTVLLSKSGAGANSATGTGTLTIGDGVGLADSAVVSLSAGGQIADTAAVVLASDGRFNLNNHSETVGSIAGNGEILIGTGQLITGGNNSSTSWSGELTGAAGSLFQKEGSGTLTIASTVGLAGTVNLNAGTLALGIDNLFTGTVNVLAGTTLRLSNSHLQVANLNFTGTGVVTLDFAGTASRLDVTNLTLGANVTLNIINWQDASDFFYAQNFAGASLDVRGASPLDRITFNSPTWSGSDTIWQSGDRQITPVPEPSTYGAMLLGLSATLLGWRRWKKTRLSVAKK